MKAKYKFMIDGIGVQHPDIQRQNLETGVAYQKQKMLEYWHASTSTSGFICVYERHDDDTFGQFPSRVFEVFQTGEETEITLEKWKERRLHKRQN